MAVSTCARSRFGGIVRLPMSISMLRAAGERLLSVFGAGYALFLAAGLFCSACATAPAKSTGEDSAKAAPSGLDRDLVVLPNNTALYALKHRLVAVRREGDILWEATLPAQDEVIAPVAVALNSAAYVRSGTALHAIAPDGKWAWSKHLDAQAHEKTPDANAPVTLPDSTVAVAVADDIVHFDEKGVAVWRATLPDGHLIARMRAGMDGAIFAPTTAGLYCISPDGNVSWVRAIGN
ncbi:MAG TPA: PQQ-binding-like beta-propeller repeat protein [Polyangiaceae bacterium]|nr:PQQ-binding-like beta-propeller repeat protein [Polyangiaceae bacterium]